MDYQTTIQDIRDHKANQWRFSHYGLLVQAAIVAFLTQFDTMSPSGKLILVALSVAAYCVVISLVHEAQTKIAQGRSRHRALLSSPSEAWLEFATTIKDRAKTAPNRPWEDDQRFRLLLYGVQLIGMGLAIWSITAEVSARMV